MLVQILGLVVVIVATYHVFKNARDNGRNAAGWAFATIGVGIGLQFILPIILGIIIAVIWMATGTRADELQAAIQTPAIILNFVCLGLSFVGVFLILRHVLKLPDEPDGDVSPPPPPTFDRNE